MDLLGLVPFLFVMGFATLGLVQWIKRKHIGRVDHSILLLGGFYIVVIVAYILFEIVVVNHRPILINGDLEASYGSQYHEKHKVFSILIVSLTKSMFFHRRAKHSPILKPVNKRDRIIVIIMTHETLKS